MTLVNVPAYPKAPHRGVHMLRLGTNSEGLRVRYFAYCLPQILKRISVAGRVA